MLFRSRGVINALDHRLLSSPLGLAGHRCIATLVFASGSALSLDRAQSALDSAQGLIDQHALKSTAGVTLASPQVMVLRVLAPMVEPAMRLLRTVWACWRQDLWKIPAPPSRLWNL